MAYSLRDTVLAEGVRTASSYRIHKGHANVLSTPAHLEGFGTYRQMQHNWSTLSEFQGAGGYARTKFELIAASET
jgi:hypothetical protein